jgi:hypothetical protein
VAAPLGQREKAPVGRDGGLRVERDHPSADPPAGERDADLVADVDPVGQVGRYEVVEFLVDAGYVGDYPGDGGITGRRRLP